MTKLITRTVRFEIYPTGSQEEKDSFRTFFNHTLAAQKEAMQNAYNYLMKLDIIANDIKMIDQQYVSEVNSLVDNVEKLKQENDLLDYGSKKYNANEKQIVNLNKKLENLRKSKSVDAWESINKALGYKKETQSRKLVKALNRYDIPYTSYIDVGNYKANKDYGNDREGILLGKMSPRVYKSESTIFLDKSNLQNSSSIMIKKNDNNYFWK